MHLDFRSILVVSVIVFLIISVMISMPAWRARHQETDYLRTMSVAFWAFTVGAILLPMRGVAPDWLSIVISNMLHLVFFPLIGLAVCQLTQKSFPWRVGVGGSAATALALSYYAFIDYDTGMRVVVFSLAVLIPCVVISDLLLRRAEAFVSRGWGRFLAGVLLFLVACMLARIGLVIRYPVASDYMQVSDALQLLTIVMGISVILVGVGFLGIWMHQLEARMHRRTVALEAARALAEKLREEAEEVALHDPLTGIGNRRKFKSVGHDVYRLHQETGDPVSIAFLDVDHFKKINDQHGHDVGDEVLQSLAACLTGITRRVDMIFRWGGEEFALLMPQTDLTAADQLGTRIRKQIEHMVHVKGDPVTVSIGVSELRSGESLEDVTRRADQLLYQAKRQGRNCVVSA